VRNAHVGMCLLVLLSSLFLSCNKRREMETAALRQSPDAKVQQAVPDVGKSQLAAPQAVTQAPSPELPVPEPPPPQPPVIRFRGHNLGDAMDRVLEKESAQGFKFKESQPGAWEDSGNPTSLFGRDCFVTLGESTGKLSSGAYKCEVRQDRLTWFLKEVYESLEQKYGEPTWVATGEESPSRGWLDLASWVLGGNLVTFALSASDIGGSAGERIVKIEYLGKDLLDAVRGRAEQERAKERDKL
jgi:hypothetical protein